MAKTLTYHSRTTFWAGVRALFAFDFGFAPFITLHAHLLGFGFNIIHFRSAGRLTQFSVTLSVPFYIAGFYYLPKRQDDTPAPPSDKGFTVVDGRYVNNGLIAARHEAIRNEINEREGRADLFANREGLVTESADRP